MTWNEPVAMFPEASEALQLTVVVPTSKRLPEVGVQLTGMLPSTRSTAVALNVEWANKRRVETRRKMNERLLEGYEVVVEWPAEGAGTAAQ